MNPDHSTSDPIADLLRRADGTAPLPPSRAGLSDAVRALARRRRQRRAAVVAGALACVVAVGGAAVVRALKPAPIQSQMAAMTPTRPPAPAATSPQDLAQLKAEADSRLTLARALIARERRRDELARLDGAVAASVVIDAGGPGMFREDAALTLVAHAEHLTARTNSPADVLAAYRRAAELFPETPSAAVARRKIDELQSTNKPVETPS